ncbi:MAG: aminopeptidase P family protein [Thermoplasmata archaeon]|nr:aminopeptidase P family protein [Thermoplasmata archaeon]
MKGRVRRIFKNTKERVDLIVIQTATDPYVDRTYFYVTGLAHGVMEGTTAVLYPDGSVKILTSSLEAESAKTSGLPVIIMKSGEDRVKKLKRLLGGAKRIGIHATEMTHQSYKDITKKAPKAEFVDVSDAIVKARLVKDSKELKRMVKAAKIASEVAEEIIPFIDIGKKEYEIGAELEHLMAKKGSTGPFFDTIASSGPNSAQPHYTVGDRRIQKGDFMVLDFGATYMKYGSDITRTYVVGKATKRMRSMYETVSKAQQRALAKVKAGVKGGEVHLAADRYINRTKFKGRFIHGIGHSLGLAAHDGSGLSPALDLTLEKNMVFTIEPGVYIPGYGGVRIEDDVVVKKGGYEMLTSARRDLVEI